MYIGSLVAKIEADNSKLGQGLRTAETQIKAAANKMENSLNKALSCERLPPRRHENDERSDVL